MKAVADPFQGLHLAHRNNGLPDPVRHFGLLLLQEAVKQRWAAASDAGRVAVKTALVELLLTGTRDILTEPSYLKEKLAQVVVDVAKRDWPQRWPDLLDTLEKLMATGVRVALPRVGSRTQSWGSRRYTSRCQKLGT